MLIDVNCRSALYASNGIIKAHINLIAAFLRRNNYNLPFILKSVKILFGKLGNTPEIQV